MITPKPRLRPTQSHSSRCRVLFLAVDLALAAIATAADSAPPIRPSDPSPSETIVLSPFEVFEDARDTYDATNTNSITGTSLGLHQTPLSAKIFNRTFIEEMGLDDIGSLLSSFGGLGPPLFGSGSDAQRGMQEGDSVDYKRMTSRGQTISNPRRDGLLRSDTSLMDSFDVESAEAVQGSNSLLFGSGDAGGVININSKRARLNQRTVNFIAKADSEGSTRYTTDINVGAKWVAVRINGLKSEELYFRPVLGKWQEGLQGSMTVRPLKWLTLFGEYRYFWRDHIRSGDATIRTPATFRLNNGETMDNKSTRYITGLGGSEVLGNYITLRNQDSLLGAYFRHNYTVASYSAGMEVSPLKDLHFQFRYGEDERTNMPPVPNSEVVYHPDAPGNRAPLRADGTRPWAMNVAPSGTARTEGAEGFKLTGVYRRNLGKWGDHWLNAFASQQDTYSIGETYRYLEADASGNPIFQGNLYATNSGQIAMPSVWVEPFSETVFGRRWPAKYVVDPLTGKVYKWGPVVFRGTVPVRPNNPLGTSGPIPASGARPAGYSEELIRERSKAVSLSSSLWQGRINTMAGHRFETANTVDVASGIQGRSVDYGSSTFGAVVDTPVDGVRVYGSYATNARISFGEDRDIYNQLLPIGKGVTKEAGFKFALFDHRVSGNVAYYITTGKNFTGTMSGTDRNNIDPAGINGRNGEAGFVYSKESRGLDLALSLRPLRWWQVRINYSEGNGREKSDISYPVFYNDEFNTITVNGQTAVGVKNAVTGNITPFMVPTVPGTTSDTVPLTLAMLRDRTSPYFAVLDPESGQITNATALGLFGEGIGTGRTGLPISSHQLGFVPPASSIVVRKAGERTTGYPEHSLSLVNRFQISEGLLRGTVFGFSTQYMTGIRGYMVTDAAKGGQRRLFYYPNRFENGFFATYSFRVIRKLRATLQLNIYNLFDKQTVVQLPNSSTGVVRYFSYQYSPIKSALSVRMDF